MAHITMSSTQLLRNLTTMDSMEKTEKQVRMILNAVAEEGSYNSGHLRFFLELYKRGRESIQQELIDTLGVRECQHD